MERFQKDVLAAVGSGHGSLSELRRRHVVRLLSELRLAGTCSRAELARRAELDPKTVTNLTNVLAKKGLVVPDGFEMSGGGRPAERLRLNPDSLYAIGADLGADRLRTVLIDWTGGIRASQDVGVKDRDDAKRMLAQVTGCIRHVATKARRASWKRTVGIGFASPGFLDRGRGVALEAVHLPGWKAVPVTEHLRKAFSVPVHVEEATRAAALGELWFGLGREASDFIALDLGYGIGAGIISNGRLHYGVSETAGEIGHTTVKQSGSLCRCGKRGCLETVASGEAIARLTGYPSARHAARAAVQGDRTAGRVFTQAGTYLGIAVSNLVTLLNPGMLVLGGGLCKAGDLLLKPFTKSLETRALGRSLAAVGIKATGLGDCAGAMGAASLPLQPLFNIMGE